MMKTKRYVAGSYAVEYKGLTWTVRKSFVENFGPIYYINGEGALDGEWLEPRKSLRDAQFRIRLFTDHEMAARKREENGAKLLG